MLRFLTCFWLRQVSQLFIFSVMSFFSLLQSGIVTMLVFVAPTIIVYLSMLCCQNLLILGIFVSVFIFQNWFYVSCEFLNWFKLLFILCLCTYTIPYAHILTIRSYRAVVWNMFFLCDSELHPCVLYISDFL